jgi:hypothetical protein
MILKSKEQKEKDIENTQIQTTERWRQFVTTIQWIIILILSFVILYGLYKIFEVYVFGSMTLSFIISGAIFLKMLDVPNERFIECRIEMIKDEKGKLKPRNHIFNEYKIPLKLLKEYKYEGDTRVKFKTKQGKTINIVEKIDFDNKIIKYCWFSNLSDWDFYIYEETFKICKNELENTYRDLRRHKQTRPLYYDVKFINMISDVEKEEDYSPLKEKIIDKIKGIFEDDSKQLS